MLLTGQQLEGSRPGIFIFCPAAGVESPLEFDDILQEIQVVQGGGPDRTAREPVQVVVVSRIPRRHCASAMRLLMEDGGLLPE